MHSSIHKKLIVFILLVVFFLNLSFAVDDKLNIYSPNYFGEQNNVYDEIHYLDNEFLSFEFCTDPSVESINFTLSCENFYENLLVNKFFGKRDGCYFTNYELKDINCSTFDLNINYVVKSKIKNIKRTFKRQKESLLINHILSKDYKSLTSSEVSYYLMVLNDIQDKENKENQDAYEQLKNARNNEYKCWSQSDCDLTQTIKILRNLKMAQYDQNTRLLDDGKIYLERNVVDDPESSIYATQKDDVYEFEIFLNHSFDDDVECCLKIDNEDEEVYDFDSGSTDFDELVIDNNYVGDKIDFSCYEQDNDDVTYNIDNIFLKVFNEKIYDKIYDNQDEFSYEISQADIDEYNEFAMDIYINDDFSDDVECVLDIDGEEYKKYNFDSGISGDDKFIKDVDLQEGYNFRCYEEGNDDNEYELEEARVVIYADEQDEQVYSNEDSFEYELGVRNTDLEFDYDIEFNYNFRNGEEIECILNTDGSIKKYTFDYQDQEDDKLYIKNKQVAKSVKFSCDEKLDKMYFKLYDVFGKKQVDEEYSDKSEFSYSIPATFSRYICIGEDDSCLYEDSIDALIAYGDNLQDALSIENYVSSFIVKGSNNEKYIDSEDIITDTGKYLFYKDNEDLRYYLKFKQNNDGSWGDSSLKTSQILYTSWAVLGLESGESDSEHIEDGKKWIYYNEPQQGWGNIEKNAIAYVAIREKLKPYLKFTTANEITGVLTFKVENPTIYNLKDVKVELSNEISDYTSYTQDIGDLQGEDNIDFNISLKPNFLGTKTGYIKISGVDGKNKKIDLISMPINIKGKFPFEIVSNNYVISDDDSVIDVFKKNNVDSYNLSCEYENPFLKTKEIFPLTAKDDSFKVIDYDKVEGNFSFDLYCKSGYENLVIPIMMNIRKADKTFELDSSSLMLDSYKDFSITITNLKDQTLGITIVSGGDYAGIIQPVKTGEVIAGSGSKKIYFTINNKDFLSSLNNSQGYITITGEDGYEKKVVVLFSDNAKNNSNLIMYIIITFIAASLIGLVMFRRYQLQKQDEALNSQNHHNDEEFDFDGDIEF